MSEQTSRRYLYFAVFFSGIASLALEMAASRLLEKVFGTSNLVWAVVIGLILIYLAVGYFIGGRWADRSPHFQTLYQIITWAGVAVALVPVIARPILSLAADAFDQLQIGLLAGSFTAVFVLLLVPVILMGMISPFAIRLAIQQSTDAGRISGKIYAISTLGSFLGTFLPVLLLIPTIGTNHTFLAIAALLVLTGLAGLLIACGWKKALVYAWTPLLIIGLWLWGFPGSDKNSQGQVYETESSYNYIQVIQKDGYTFLRLNEGQGVHSMYHATELNYYGPWEQVLVAPFFNKPPYSLSAVQRIAIIGLAAGTSARQATAVYGEVPIDGWEIDSKIVEVGREYFGMTMPNLTVYEQDGRWGLEHSPYRYQIISVDAYRPPYIPWHLTTQEFFQVVYDHLADDGVMVINVGRTNDDRRLIDSLGTTILTVFPTVHVIDVPNTYNSIIFASRQPTSTDNLYENFMAMRDDKTVNPLLTYSMAVAISSQSAPPQPSLVFTDDCAPVEWITNDMIVGYLLRTNLEDLQ